MNELKAFFVIYDGKNYNNWRFRMEAILDEKDLLTTIERELDDFKVTLTQKRLQEYKRIYKISRSVLIQHIADSQLDLIRDKKTPKQIWDALAKKNNNNNVRNRNGQGGGVGKKNIVNQLNLKKKLLLLKYNEAGNLQTFFNTFDKIIKDLKLSGVNLEESEIICHLLLTMPKYFDTVVKKIESLPPDNATVHFVKEALFDELNKLKDVKENGTENGRVETSNKGERNGGKSESNGRNRYRARSYNLGRNRQKSESKMGKNESNDKLNPESANTNDNVETKETDVEKNNKDEEIQNEKIQVDEIKNIDPIEADSTNKTDVVSDDVSKTEAVEVAA